MKIYRVMYSALVNLGDYQNERLGMTAILDEDESPEDAINQLRERIKPLGGMRLQRYYEVRHEMKHQIHELERKLKEYERRWNSAAEFLRAQGIKPDVPDFPQLINLLEPAIENEESGVYEGEFDSDDYDTEDE